MKRKQGTVLCGGAYARQHHFIDIVQDCWQFLIPLIFLLQELAIRAPEFTVPLH